MRPEHHTCCHLHVAGLLVSIKAVDIVFSAPRTWLTAIASDRNQISKGEQCKPEKAAAPMDLARDFPALRVDIPGFPQTTGVTLFVINMLRKSASN
jgi:hypothetical protein